FVAHEPSGLIGTEAHISVDLQRAHAFFADQHQVNNFVPVAKWLIRIFEDCARQMREAITVRGALFALPVMAGSERIDLDVSTARATDAFRPTARDQIADAIVFSLK